MAGLGRSLSLNTGAAAAAQPAKSGGLFGGALTAQPQQQTGSLFGSTPATTSAAGGGLFGSAIASQPQQSGGLFGGAQLSQPQQSGGLFGQTQTSQPAQSGGLFGQSQQSQPQQTGGLFGQAQAQTSQPQQTGGLFGQSQQSQPQKPGSLFSFNSSSQPAAALAQTGSLFGGLGATTSQPQSGGLFSSLGASSSTPQNATQQPPKPSLFSASTQPPKPTLFGLGASTQNQQQSAQQTIPGVKIDASNIKPTTRMFELHEDLQNMIVQIDDMIQGGIRSSMSCSGMLPQLGAKIEQLPVDVAYLESKLETVEGALVRDAVDVGSVKEVVRTDAGDAMALFSAVENLKLPNQFHYSGIGANLQTSTAAGDAAAPSTDLLAYFNAQAEDLARRTAAYEAQLREVESHLRIVEGSAVEGIEKLIRMRIGEGDVQGEGIRDLVQAMRGFEEAVLRVARGLGGVRESVVDVSLGQLGRGM